jgi:hypothetical protein
MISLSALPGFEGGDCGAVSDAPPGCAKTAGDHGVCGVHAISVHTRTSMDLYRPDSQLP